MKKKLLLKIGLGLVAGFLSLPSPAQAADQPGPGDRVAAIAARIREAAKELNLTDQQKEALKPIVRATIAKVRAVRQDSSLSRRGKLQALRAIRAETAPQVKAILTPEQLAQWRQMAADRRARLLGT